MFVQAVSVDDEFGERDPAQEIQADGRQLNDEGEVGEVNFGHSNGSNKKGAPPVPVQARFKSSVAGSSIGDVAKSMGLRPSAIRYYEAQGLLPALPRSGGKRVMTVSAMSRLKLIVEARNLGLGIRALRKLSDLDQDEWRAEAQRIVGQMKREIAAIATRIERLNALSECECKSGRDCAVS